MATLAEYWATDAKDMLTGREFEIRGADGEFLMTLQARVHLNFDACAKFVSFLIPARNGVAFPEALCLNAVDQVLALTDDLEVTKGFAGQMDMKSTDLKFTGRVFLYSEDPVPPELQEQLRVESAKVGHSLVFRSQSYVIARNEAQKPVAFISHDSRDKVDIAKPLAIQLISMNCPVWYDEFSLQVGDSLRESIERGLKECKRCIFLLTPHFLANGGWSKREYQSIFTRELIENEKLILPVWAGVTPEQVFDYSPILADRKGLNWNDGVEVVANHLIGAIRR